MSTRSRGTLHLSVDLEQDAARPPRDKPHALDGLLARLLELFARYQMPVTWGVADPAVSAARDVIATSTGGHELAILGDASWIGREAGRGRFARELERRVAAARAACLAVDTLALKAELPIDHCDLVLREGLVAARLLPSAEAGSAARRLQPRTLRFGLWGFPVTLALPGRSRWLPGGGGARAARLVVDEAVATAGLAQLLVDAPRLAARGSAAERVLERVLQHADRRRRHGLLEVATLGATAQRMAREHQGQPSRSILRPAA